MPKRIVPLSDLQISKAKPKLQDYKLGDGRGLYLLVRKTGGKLWRYDYRMGGKRKTLAMGNYPDINLAEARKRHQEARKLVAEGIDPGEEKKARRTAENEQQANTFKKVALEWHRQRTGTLSAKTLIKSFGYLERNVFPTIGDIPLSELSPRIILENVLRPIETRGAIETAHRVRSTVSQVLRYGVACQYCEHDLTADLRGALRPVQKTHRPAILEPAKIGALLRAIDGFDGTFVVKCALQLHPLVATRPGELRHAEWTEINFETATWEIPAGKMKMKNPHIVPLSDAALQILRELHLLTGQGKYLFPSVRSSLRPISDNTLNAALRRLGYRSEEMVSHGWRATFRTLADEVLQERIDIIEAQLAHQVADTLGRAYNRTSFLKERRALMNRWAQYLEGLRNKKTKTKPQ